MNFVLTSNNQQLPYFQMNSLKKLNDITNNTQSTELLTSSLIDNKVFTVNEDEEFFKSTTKRIVLNVRGIKFDVIPSLFNKYPTSRLGRLNNFLICNKNTLKQQDLLKICDDFDLKTKEFYFNKDPYIFNLILNLYNDNDKRIHVSEGICWRYLSEQLNYWGLGYELSIEKCCKMHLNTRRDQIEIDVDMEDNIKDEFNCKYNFGMGFIANLRKKFHNYIENPLDSIIGMV
jgi:hypothetical protein